MGLSASEPALFEPLERLYEADGLPSSDLSDELEALYGGPLGFDRPRLCANFVSTLDGVVAIDGEARSNRLVSDDSEADRFVMGLLRALADVVLIGSGTLRGAPQGLWTAEAAYPQATGLFRELRRRLGQPPAPQLAIVTGSGAIDVRHPALEAGALVLTTGRGAAALRTHLPSASTVLSLGPGQSVDPLAAVEALRALGRGLVVSEAGPHLFGALLAAGLVDELFLTLSPLFAGRAEPGARLGLVEGVEVLPGRHVEGRLLGARRQRAHLFVRYELMRREAQAAEIEEGGHDG